MSVEQAGLGTDRRQFLTRTAASGAGLLVIVGAAQIAEALAGTTYTNIIDRAPFFTRLASDDQGYLRGEAGGDVSLRAGAERDRQAVPFTTF